MRKRKGGWSGTAAALAAGAAALLASAAPSDNPSIVTRVPGNSGANDDSGVAAINRNGRSAVFESSASNLVDGDGNDAQDVFHRDLRKGITTRVSVADDGTEANGTSGWPSVSASGRLVLFESDADNLVEGDGNGTWDVFLRDLRRGTTTRVSVAEDGAEASGASNIDGAALSASGRYAVFTSTATDLVPGGTTGARHVYLVDLRRGTLVLVTRNTAGAPSDGSARDASISASGRFVAYSSNAGDLVPGDGNGGYDVFVFDRKTGSTVLASADLDGGEANGNSRHPVLSKSGRIVAFTSNASDLVPGDGNAADDVFVRDLRAGATVRVSVDAEGNEADGDSHRPSLSWNGKQVAFVSQADGLVPEDGNGEDDVLVRDLKAGTLRLLSSNARGDPADGESNSFPGSLSGNGKWLVLTSAATNLSNQDRNGDVADVFLVPAR